jgi:hypothetical protein
MLLSATSSAHALTATQELQSRKYLIGKWNCSYTVGARSGTYATTWASVLNGRWLLQSYDQPDAPGAPGFRAEYFIGYDEARQAWVRFGAMTTGQYFAIRMTDARNAGWSWKYVSFFPRRRPETPGSDATFTKRSDVEYTVDGPTYREGGKTVTEHHVCKKIP